ncbi:beta-aspartyl-dipeptidase (metallo-type) [Marchantia polymorpha subsp. ruderalis]|uniref:dihydropyrimidinase n=2 Tax=Marchantia polymorpha TaxID=3197 RepID=A0AAF6AMY1_MARPO|nr:hypothetical protein MARPO_0036s0087 [Marchantia polymorpha]BBM97801.1 hypothetical protein Mp_1g08440 [Marchantia polymorpha subsp. ruderalis]|eukprot:PTQ41104.1 hypothetical protein MARPO_0036s0087 [Marchantia polymorpha]
MLSKFSLYRLLLPTLAAVILVSRFEERVVCSFDANGADETSSSSRSISSPVPIVADGECGGGEAVHTQWEEAAPATADVKFTSVLDGTLGPSDAVMTLLVNGLVYNPMPVGKSHILMAGTSVVAILQDQQGFSWSNLEGLPGLSIIDVNGSVVVPGFIDMHVHVIGGGGELGPASRTPEAGLSQLVNAGLTTVVGILGTDCVSRSLENLRVKAVALKDDGLTAYMWSGCYRVPSPTITGSLIRDMVLIDEVVGAGEIAISDHRGSWPSTDDLLKMVSDARVGGMLTGKAGLVHAHMGQGPTMLDPLWDVINISKGAIPITQFVPTHISSRGPGLKEAAERWVAEGGRADLTSDQKGESAAFDTLVDWGKRPDFALDRISISSDGFGSLPLYDTSGKLLEYGVASPDSNLNTIRRLVLEAGWPLERALQFSTVNPATFLSLPRKGRLEVGVDADLLVIDAEQLDLQFVFAKGQMMKSPSWTKRGWFEK